MMKASHPERYAALICFVGLLAAVAMVMLSSSVAAAPKDADDGRKLALLIGVSDYQILAPAPSPGQPGDLKSTPFDIARMIRASRDLGVADADMIVLADRLDPAETDRRSDGRPTRQAIISAFQTLAGKARAGDQVLVYFTGHGAQQPDKADAFGPPDERDGFDELILPADIQYWSDRDQAVPGAITDDELGRAVEAIRGRGAFVWLVVDACHSGTSLRGGPTTRQAEVEIKALPASALRIPTVLVAKAREIAARRDIAGAFDQGSLDARSIERGGVVAFYAAGADQTAIARPFEEGPDRPLGMLTFAITRALISGRAASYRDLALMVQGVYAAPGYTDGQRQAGFDGDLDRAVLGMAVAPPRQWQVRRVNGDLTLDGGLLDGVRNGDILSVRYGDLTDPFVYLRVESATPTSAKLAPVDYAGVGAGAAARIGQHFTFLATRAASAVSLDVRVGRPPPTGSPSSVDSLLENALNLIAADPSRTPGVALEFAPPGAPADVYLRAGPDRIWFADQPEGFDRDGRAQPPWLVVNGATRPEDFSQALAQRLRLIARSTTLLRAMSELQLGDARHGVKIDYFVDRPVTAGGYLSETTRCGAKPAAPFTPPVSAVSLDRWLQAHDGLPRLRHCDVVYVRVSNSLATAVDITPLYFSRDGSIQYLALGTGLADDDVRIPPGAERYFFFRVLTASGSDLMPVGQEQLAVIAVPVRAPGATVVSYRYLAQASAPPMTRTAATSLDRLLDAAGFGVGPSRGPPTAGSESAVVLRSSWMVGAP